MSGIWPQHQRSWLTTREVRALLGVSQQRVSRLAVGGAIASEIDDEGRRRYDRESVERFAADRAARAALSAAEGDERRARDAEARDRFARDRKRRVQEERERREADDEFRRRVVRALEAIAKGVAR